MTSGPPAPTLELPFARSLRVAADRGGLLVFIALGVTFGLGYAASGAIPIDMPWRADLTHLYGHVWGADAESRYVYPPVIAQVIVALHHIGQPAAVLLWTFALFAGAWAAYRQWSLVILLLAIPAVFVGFGWPLMAPVIYPLIGNVQPLIAAVCVLGLRYPVLWVFPIITKVGPGIGILWFAFRGEWRSFVVAVSASVLIVIASLVLSPNSWLAFVDFARNNAGTAAPIPTVPVPLIVRVPMSVALLAWGAPRNKQWTVPIAVGWSALALYDWSYLAIWASALPLLSNSRRAKADVSRAG